MKKMCFVVSYRGGDIIPHMSKAAKVNKTMRDIGIDITTTDSSKQRNIWGFDDITY